jgi:hypothetical protein
MVIISLIGVVDKNLAMSGDRRPFGFSSPPCNTGIPGTTGGCDEGITDHLQLMAKSWYGVVSWVE